ncbi:3-isopropylmalate dehydrogenase, partial [Catenaria anguillulae PL171]
MSAEPNHVLILPGDGIGPEITSQAQRILDLFPKRITTATHLVGGAAIDAAGSPLPDDTLAAVRDPKTRAILLGAVGGPKWDKVAQDIRPERGLLALRQELDVFANLRPVYFPAESCKEKSPLKSSALEGFNKCTIVRELCSGIYFGDRTEAQAVGQDGEIAATDSMRYTRSEIARITRLAGNLAMQSSPPERITLVDKANVLATSRLWRSTVTHILATEFPQVPFSTCLVDTAAMLMVKSPATFNGIILTENMFGDIISDEASIIPGSLGLMPSASVKAIPSPVGLYEPIHGSAPDIAGQGKANPIGTILSVAMMFRYSLDMAWEADLVEEAVRKTIEAGITTADIGGKASTAEVGDAIVAEMQSML